MEKANSIGIQCTLAGICDGSVIVVLKNLAQPTYNKYSALTDTDQSMPLLILPEV